MAAPRWEPQVFAPYPAWPEILFARIAARSPQFDPVCAAGERPVIIGSAAGHQREQVVTGARGELVERVSNILAGRAAEAAAAVVATHRDLRRKGIPALDPAELAHRGTSSTPDEARDIQRLWVLGQTVPSGADCYVPAGAVYLHHRPPTGCDPAPGVGSTGVAAHPDPQAAAEHAAWETLERDLLRRSWYGQSPVATLLTPVILPEPLTKLLDGLDVEATALDVPAPGGTRCVAVCLHAPDRTQQTFGARCGPDDGNLGRLLEKAAYEALMVRWSVDSPVGRATWDSWGGRSAPDSAVRHALWAYHRQDSLGRWTAAAPPESGRRPTAPPDTPGKAGLNALNDHTGRELVLVDTTHGPARPLEMSVVRIVATGARPLPTRPDGDRDPPVPRGPHPFG
ncbi:YcaO-like family protein [Streptomyces noursei]|uniref:YcaO-like family protein n=1 Tax=Streptomyces noursei TaxID=1971 RepID=UPI0023B7745F|nr:YcaO-like family protein [Streptomyces noursei]